MAFIETTAPEATRGEARSMLERQQQHWGFVPNYAKLYTDRADVMNRWASLLSGIRRNLDRRRFELVTFAASLELGSSYCALAHGKVLRDEILTAEEMHALLRGDTTPFCEAEVAMMDLARKVVADASAVRFEDVDRLRRAGVGEVEIFDVVAAAAARAFFSKIGDALGAQPDSSFLDLEEELRHALTVGRPIDSEPTRRLEPT